MPREVQVNRFRVQTDNGKAYVIIEYQQYLSADAFDNTDATVEGQKRFATSIGLHVNRLDDETFQIIETDEIVRKAGK